MGAKLAEKDQMTVEEFLAFSDTRPDGERWELIEGMAIMNASATDWHQTVCLNIAAELRAMKLSTGASWTPVLDLGTRVPVSPNSLPRPDVLIKDGELTGTPIADDAIVIFEVLSKSNSASDRNWRKRIYASVPNCAHYVTVSMTSAEIVRHDRADSWKPTLVTGLRSTLALPAIQAKLRLRDIYRWTPIE